MAWSRPRAIAATGTVTDEAVAVTGLSFEGFTSVKLYDGTDATGTLVVHAATPGTVALANPVEFRNGLHVVAAGAGKGSVWLH